MGLSRIRTFLVAEIGYCVVTAELSRLDRALRSGAISQQLRNRQGLERRRQLLCSLDVLCIDRDDLAIARDEWATRITGVEISLVLNPLSTATILSEDLTDGPLGDIEDEVAIAKHRLDCLASLPLSRLRSSRGAATLDVPGKPRAKTWLRVGVCGLGLHTEIRHPGILDL